MPGPLDLGVQPDEQRAARRRDDRPVQGGVPDLELVVIGRPLAAAQAAVHLLEVTGGGPGHDQGHGGRLEQAPDRHHVGRGVIVGPRSVARGRLGRHRSLLGRRSPVQSAAQERAPAHLA